VYVETTGDVKRNILRYIESPIRKMGMDSPELMTLLDTFPKGAETLITRIIHILTDKSNYKATTGPTTTHACAGSKLSSTYILVPPFVVQRLCEESFLSSFIRLLALASYLSIDSYSLSLHTALPSVDLVSRVRNLYAKRVSDVRFLIPVLNGLSKSEILSALPKLIKLNPNVVKEVSPCMC